MSACPSGQVSDLEINQSYSKIHSLQTSVKYSLTKERDVSEVSHWTGFSHSDNSFPEPSQLYSNNTTSFHT